MFRTPPSARKARVQGDIRYPATAIAASPAAETANAGRGLSAPVTIGRCGALIASSFLSHQSLNIWLKPHAKNPIARSVASCNVHGRSFSVQDNLSSL